MTSTAPLSLRSVDQRATSTTPSGFVKSQSSALRGASLAFRAPHPSPKPLVNTYSGTNGALAAATRAGLGPQKEKGNTFVTMIEIQTPKMPQEMIPDLTGQRTLRRAPSRSMEILRIPSTSIGSSRQPSPSQIAAKLAAARSTPTPGNLGNPGTNGRHAQGARGQSRAVHEHKDETPIPATNTLVQLFELKEVSKDVSEGATISSPPSARSESRPRSVLSPKPIRPSVSLRLSSRTLNQAARYADGEVAATRSEAGQTIASPRPINNKSVAPKSAPLPVTGLFQSVDSQKRPPQLPPPRRAGRSSPTQITTNQKIAKPATPMDGNSSDSSYTSARNTLSRTTTLSLTTPSKPLEKPTMTLPKRPVSQPPKPLPPRQTSINSLVSTSSYTTTMPHRLAPQLTADSLANAMVASSLASSRAPSPSKRPPPPPLSRRHSRPFFLPGRTPSPIKSMGMRHTMRKDASSSEEEPERRRNHVHLLKKHPNKHAEGDRKRWRDSITERERKRYEGVWAANRGLLLLPPYLSSRNDSSDPSLASCVHAYVVRDIWQRSHLPTSTLSAIWELVDGLKMARLRREEFIVGTWLVDQCLKGRKLPVKVGESVWESVRVVGVKVKGGTGGFR